MHCATTAQNRRQNPPILQALALSDPLRVSGHRTSTQKTRGGSKSARKHGNAKKKKKKPRKASAQRATHKTRKKHTETQETKKRKKKKESRETWRKQDMSSSWSWRALMTRRCMLASQKQGKWGGSRGRRRVEGESGGRMEEGEGGRRDRR
eukprot:2157038-Rhodomonas_salina.1